VKVVDVGKAACGSWFSINFMAVSRGTIMDELKTIELELNQWSKILNIAVGAPSLAFALACVSLPKYVNLVGCILSIAMWVSLMAYARPSFSKKLDELRSMEKKIEGCRK